MPKRLFGKKETAERAAALAKLKKEKRKRFIETKTDSNGQEVRVWNGKMIPVAKVTMEDIQKANSNERDRSSS